MGSFPTVVIRHVSGAYRIAQDGRDLLVVPERVMEGYESDAVFPPQWRLRLGSSPERRLFWQPNTLEYLMAGLEAHPARVVEALGSEPYRSYLQGFWLPNSSALILRLYWDPPDPLDAFGDEARRASLRVQTSFLDILRRLRPPEGLLVVLNATEAYLDAIGINGPDALDLDTVREVSLTPAVPLSSDEGARALEVVATHLAGTCFPVLENDRLRGLYALSLRDLQAGEALLAELGLLSKEGPFFPS